MMFRLLSAFRPALFLFPPERAHAVTLAALKLAPREHCVKDDARLGVDLLGLHFPNPVGVAAGFDKNAQVPDRLLALGFGFAEVGGVTLFPQAGNPQPRVFRLGKDGALINRLGFNNDGVESVRARLEKFKALPGIVGANLGINKDSNDYARDFPLLMQRLDRLVDFVTLNISSPNTPGLRTMQEKDALDVLLARVMDMRANIRGRKNSYLPVLLKLAPDVTLGTLDAIAALCLEYKVDGLIISNTTVSRPYLRESLLAQESGGLSGKPLFELSTRRLAQMRQRVGRDMVLIGVGGIDSGEAAWAKICAGANLLQLYTGLVYQGLGLLDEIKATLLARLAAKGLANLQQAVGLHTDDYAQEL
jgi:dihydroorotate dehydrogenase